MEKDKKSRRRGRRSSERSNGMSEEDDASRDGVIGRFQKLSMNPRDNELIPCDVPPKQPVLYYGWFFSNEVSLLIKEIAFAYMSTCLENVKEFKCFMKDASQPHEILDPLLYYQKPGKSKESEEFSYHITSKFLDRKPNLEYTTMVQPFIKKMFRMHIVGFYFTTKTYGIRVKLTDAQKYLFDQREGTNEDGSSASKLSTDDTDSGTIIGYQTAILEELESYKLPIKIKTRKCKFKLHSKAAKRSCTVLPLDVNDFKPTSSRAHITVGCGPGVKAVQTGKDLLKIIQYEKEVDSVNPTSTFHEDYSIDGGTLRQFGRLCDAFVIYPCHEISVEAMFNEFT